MVSLRPRGGRRTSRPAAPASGSLTVRSASGSPTHGRVVGRVRGFVGRFGAGLVIGRRVRHRQQRPVRGRRRFRDSSRSPSVPASSGRSPTEIARRSVGHAWTLAVTLTGYAVPTELNGGTESTVTMASTPSAWIRPSRSRANTPYAVHTSAGRSRREGALEVVRIGALVFAVLRPGASASPRRWSIPRGSGSPRPDDPVEAKENLGQPDCRRRRWESRSPGTTSPLPRRCPPCRRSR